MASAAQTMEEELQQSFLLSENAEYETTDSFVHSPAPQETQIVAEAVLAGPVADPLVTGNNGEEDEELSDRDASGEEVEEEDASGEEDHDHLAQQIVVGDVAVQEDDNFKDEDEEEDGDDDDMEEGVGAVKIKPGESENDDDADSDVSELLSAPDEESDEEEAAWEEADVADEDDESDITPPKICIFCKQDEENDPSEDFEAFLDCKTCGENAHHQCARDAAAITEKNHSRHWQCPDCYTGDSDDGTSQVKEDDVNAHEAAQPTSRLSSLSKHEPEISDSAKTSVLDTEAPNGEMRELRKRKTSSVEPYETGGSFRKRRKRLSGELSTPRDGGPEQFGETSRSSRAQRLKNKRQRLTTIERRSRTSLILKMEVRPGNLKDVLARKKRDRKRPAATSLSKPVPPPRSTPSRPTTLAARVTSLPTPFTSDLCSQSFYSFLDKETDDSKAKPYGGILNEAEADTSKTFPTNEDRKRFDQAKKKVEDEWRARLMAMQAGADVPVRKPKKTNENASQIECIEFGGWEIDTWYAAPYPAEYTRNRVLFICEFCLKYMNSDYVAWRHKLKCAAKHPPGDEIYRYESISIFEVDGRKHPVYCQNLCLLAKLFLGSKTLYYDVEPFLFYILCEYDERGYHFVGYFSKEKRASSQNNVSCILTLPIHQRKGYGNLLIDFSYLLTKTERKTGSPEKPLSDMGLVSYRNYWRLELCRYFLDIMTGDKHNQDGLSVKQISDEIGMTPDDVVSALEGLRALVRDPQSQLYAFRIDLDYCRQYVAKWESKGYVRLKPEALVWTPYVMGRTNAFNFELGPSISTMASCEVDETKMGNDTGDGDTEPQPAFNGDHKELSVVGETSMMNGSGPLDSIEKAMLEDKENAESQDHVFGVATLASDSWAMAYKGIPPTRFEIFPAAGAGRRSDRGRQTAGRSTASRAVGSSSRSRRPAGCSRQPQADQQLRSSGSRRKTSGTGRGPGRWPRGLKKADYGNADSGPGLPHAWRATEARFEVIPEGLTFDTGLMPADEPTQDEVQVFVAKTATNGKPALEAEHEPDVSDGAVGREGRTDVEEVQFAGANEATSS